MGGKVVQFSNSSGLLKRASGVQASEGSSLSKTDLRYWRERVFKPIYTRAGRRHTSPNWACYIQFRGDRRKWSLGTPNREAAAARARDVYLLLQTGGWDAATQRYRPALTTRKQNVTIGEFLGAVKDAAGPSKAKTIEEYCIAFRGIIAAVFGIPSGKEKYDHRRGGHAKWITQIHSIKLSVVTPAKVQAWKHSFLARAKRDPLSQRRAKVSLNSLLRQARCLFSPKILRQLAIELPDPLPFAGITFEPRQSLKYRSNFDVAELIDKARGDLAESDPEAYKIFLLASMAGLRRNEIDLLEWSSFRWDAGEIRIEPTSHFRPKSEESIADIAVDPELLEVFRGYQASATGEFVIESTRLPKDVTYSRYRAHHAFVRLNEWLRKNGVKGNKPLHMLRKEYGSQINSIYGIHAASRALRHADIRVTNEYYVDSRARVTPGFGHLLTSEVAGLIPSDKKSDITVPAGAGKEKPVKRKGESR
jgi:integrase